jgi:hypothetical protein
MHLKALPDAVFRCHSEASRSDEPGTHEQEPAKSVFDAAAPWERTVFMGSGLGPADRPGMTKVI